VEEKDKRLESQTEHNENGKDNEQDYEKICYICRRPESKAGSMIVMPGNMCLCHDCMQKAFDSVMGGGMDFSKMDFSRLSGMPFMNSLKGMVFEKAFTVTPTTSLTMKAIFLRKRFYEDCAYLIDRIEEKESQLIQYLASEGYKFEYIGFEERFEEKLYGRHVASYTPTTMLNWYLLCDICSTNQRKCYLVHDITESHPPFQSGLLEEFFHQIVSKPKDDREREERRMQWELGKYYLDEQISFLSDFINPDVPKIYMSDHASGITDMSE